MRSFTLSFRLLSALVAVVVAPSAAAQERPSSLEEEATEPDSGSRFRIEVKTHYRDSDEVRFPVPFPFSPQMLPPGQSRGFLETVEAGEHGEVSVVTLEWQGAWRPWLESLVKVDFIDLHDRNPTSTDEEWDVDEAWLRFGRETEPALLAEGSGAYLKVGKFPAFERQDDRHLESYGLVATTFNRMEDVGVEIGARFGRRFYLKASYTDGNPVFLRDPNALAGDNGIPLLMEPFPDPARKSGLAIPYDADVAVDEVDFEEPEIGIGVGLRLADEYASRGMELLAFGRQRDLAQTVVFDGSFYGGDLDLLRGPLNLFPFPLTSDTKEETGANLWVYAGGFSLFAQFVDQDLGGLDRTGSEAEIAWRFDLPLAASVAGRQLFPSIAPAIRWSRLDPDFAAPAVTPSPSFAWEWEKLDAGLRLGVLGRTDLTFEYAANTVTLASGAELDFEELLVSLRLRYGQ